MKYAKLQILSVISVLKNPEYKYLSEALRKKTPNFYVNLNQSSRTPNTSSTNECLRKCRLRFRSLRMRTCTNIGIVDENIGSTRNALVN